MRPSRPRNRKTSRPIAAKPQPASPKPCRLSAQDEDRLLDQHAEKHKQFGDENQMLIVKNPAGYTKMSEVLNEFIDPFVATTHNAAEYRGLVILATVAWNAALLGPDERTDFLENMAQTFRSGTQRDFYDAVSELIEHKERYFAHYQRHILDVQVTETNYGYHLSVLSPIEPSE